MPRYQLLAIDIDGTLVDREENLSPATREALARAGRAGIRVVLATGRRYSRSLPLVEPLGIDVPLITSSGALIKDPADHSTLFCAQFEPGLLRRILALIARRGHEPVVCADTFAEGFDYYIAHEEVENPELAEYLRLNPGCGRLWPGLLTDPPPGVFTGFAMGTREEMIELERALEAELPGRLYSHVLRSPRYTGFMCELSPAGVDKWSAILRLAGLWKTPCEAICAVGDDVNDIPMIRAAGLGIAMGNAVTEVKAAAGRIAPSQADDGLVRVVEWLLA